jgi:purine-binding chemotaxis protein CheW
MSDSQTINQSNDSEGVENANGSEDFVTITIAGQLFGIPVLTVQDVLSPQQVTCIPLAPPEVAGSLNLRGRIVTAIDVRTCLGLPPHEDDESRMSVVVELGGELYSLLVDTVGEVLSVENDAYENSPVTLDPRWRDVSAGIYRLDGQLLVIFDVSRLLRNTSLEAA